MITLAVSLETHELARPRFGGLGLIVATSKLGLAFASMGGTGGAEEWPVLAAALLLLEISAMAAVAIPGRRASLLEPSVTLRSE